MILGSAINLNPPQYGFERFMRNDSQDLSLVKSSESQQASSTAENKNTDAAAALTPEEERAVAQLKATDRKVHQHEQAHLAVGADLVMGAASYTYQTGPDKHRYAIGGEVSIDTSAARNAEATIIKARHIQATALAPADPSPQDQRVASKGRQMEMDALRRLAEEKSAPQSKEASFYQSVERSADPDAVSIGGNFSAFA